MKKPFPPEMLDAMGVRLETLATLLGLKDVEIAEKLDVSPAAWNNYTKGTRPIPVNAALELARITGTNIDWIYGGIEGNLTVDVLKKLKDCRPSVRLVKEAETPPERQKVHRARNR